MRPAPLLSRSLPNCAAGMMDLATPPLEAHQAVDVQGLLLLLQVSLVVLHLVDRAKVLAKDLHRAQVVHQAKPVPLVRSAGRPPECCQTELGISRLDAMLLVTLICRQMHIPPEALEVLAK